MSATEQMRAMLDGLMGTARDGSDSKRQHLHFTDSRVCRAFLLDCCPHDIFASTKLELGECLKVHDPALRADYILANREEDLMYEVSALERLQAFVNESDKKTEYLKRKLAETQEELTAEETSKLNRVHDLTESLGKKLAEVDKAEVDGETDLKQKLIEESERIKKERVAAEAEYRQVSRPASSHQQQNLRVCDICSAYLGINDNDSRLADHFGGKLHLGFITVREKLDDLKKIVSEKKSSTRRSYNPNDRSERVRGHDRDRDRDRERDHDYKYDRREYDRSRVDYHRGSSRDHDRYRDVDRDRYRERVRDDRYHDRERDRSRSSSRYYHRENRDSRPRDRYRDERLDRDDRMDRAERHDSIHSNRSNNRGHFESVDNLQQDRDMSYQKRLREWEKREQEKARKYAIRQSEEQDRKQLEEQESRKLKEFLEDYKDDRDDTRFYRGSALARRLADRRKEIEQDILSRQKEKMDLEMLSRSCAASNSIPQPIEIASEDPVQDNDVNGGSSEPIEMVETKSVDNEPVEHNTSSTSSKVPTNAGPNKVSTSEEKRRQVEELIGSIPTDRYQLFAKQLDWSLLDANLMEKRIRPWVSKKVFEYMGDTDATSLELIDFICNLLKDRHGGSRILDEMGVVLGEDDAEKFVVHLWRLLIFELEAKKIGLRK